MYLRVFYVFVLFFLSLTSLVVYGQQQYYIDSLNNKLINANDSQKIGIYNGLSWAYKFSNPSLAYEYAENAHQLSKELNNVVGQAISLNRMGAAKLKLGELNGALAYMLNAVEIAEKYNKPRIWVTSFRQIGEVYEAQGNTPEAMKYYYNALSIADSISRPIATARSALKVAGLYIKIKQYQNANHYLEYAIEEFEKNNFLRGLHQAYILKGEYFYKQNMADSALLNYNIAITHLNSLKDKQGHATAITKIAKVYEFQKKFKQSIEGYLAALDIFKSIGDKKGIVLIYVSLASVYKNAGIFKEGIRYAKLAIDKATALGFPNERKEAYYILFKLYKTIDEQNLAINYLEQYMFLTDSLTLSSESWRVEQMRKAYDLELQLKENKLNSVIITNQKLIIKNDKLLQNFLITLVIIILVLVILIWYALNHSKKVNKQLTLANEEKNDAISLISHDLKSPFNKIKGLAHLLELQFKNADETTIDILSKINTVTHDGLTLVQNLVDIKSLTSGSYTIKHTSFDLNEFLKKRVQEFEQIAQSKNIELNFESTEINFNVFSHMNSIARIFDNILSNAIKFSPIGETVLIKCSKIKNNFSFSISDNGKGINQEDINKIFGKYKTGLTNPTGNELSNGLGLAIVSSLINKLGGSIKCISEVGKGATFIVSLPLNLTQLENKYS